MPKGDDRLYRVSTIQSCCCWDCAVVATLESSYSQGVQ